MKWILLLSSVLLLNGLTRGAATEPAAKNEKNENAPVEFEKGKVRELKVTLYDEKAKPAAGVTVHLYGQDRGSRWPVKEDGASEEKKDSGKDDSWWNFKSGDDGTFIVRFPVKASAYGEGTPHPGAYYLVAEMPDGRRSVSARIFHGVTPDQAADYELNEWDSEDGGDRIYTDEAHDVDMQLTLGRTVTGMMVDPDGKPLSGRTFSAVHDLHVDSHTGAGGEIFHVKATADDKGHFQLEHVYPTACELSVVGDGAWTRTQIKYKTKGGTSARWINEPLGKLPDLPDEDSVELTLVIAPKAPTYHYFGTVTDETGKPQAGLVVAAGVSSVPVAEEYSDMHRFETTKTDSDGKWTLEASAPYVRFFDIRKDEKSEDSLGGEGYENDAFDLAAPGEYNLKLKPPGPPPSAAPPKKAKKK